MALEHQLMDKVQEKLVETELDVSMQKALNNIVESYIVPCTMAAIFGWEDQVSVMLAGSNDYTKEIAQISYRTREGLIGVCADTREPTIVNNVNDSAVKSRILHLDKEGYKGKVTSALHVPIFSNDHEVVGVFEFLHLKEGIYNITHQRDLLSLGYLIGPKIQSHLKDKRSMAAGRIFAHDMDNLLAALLPGLDVISDPDMDLQLKEALAKQSLGIGKKIHSKLHKYQALLRSRTNNDLDLDSVYPAEIVREIAEGYREIVVGKEINYFIDCPTQIQISLDIEKITGVLENILGNAVKFTSPGENIYVRCYKERMGDSNYFCFSVQDTGTGIADEHQDLVFTDFTSRQGDVVNEQGQGYGLLWARQTVKRHKGKIWVDSEPGKGTTFTVALPYGY